MIRDIYILLIFNTVLFGFTPQTKAELQTAVDLWVNDNASALSTYGEINSWDVSLITDMEDIFRDKATFNDDISSWNVSNVTTMRYMFHNATSFNQNLNNWDVSSVTIMYTMFYNATSFNQPLNDWNVSNVTNMGFMFKYAYDFNQDISAWDVSNVWNMSRLFLDASSFNQDISSWDVSSATDMNNMFDGTVALSDENKCLIHESFSSISGDGIADGACDCAGNVDLGCGCAVPLQEGLNCSGNPLLPFSYDNKNNISVKGNYDLVLTSERTVVSWKISGIDYGQLETDGISNVFSVSSGVDHHLALLMDSTVIGWGKSSSGQIDVPTGLSDVVAISGSLEHSLALKADGNVIAWGDNEYGQCNIPDGLSNVVSIAAGYRHNLAITLDGNVVAWGDNEYGQCDVPDGLSNVVSISADMFHNLAILSDKSVVAWGHDWGGSTNVPEDLGDAIEVSAGYQYSLVLTSDGKVTAFGLSNNGNLDVPYSLTDVVSVKAGQGTNIALRSDGTVGTWGGCMDVNNDSYCDTQDETPPGLVVLVYCDENGNVEDCNGVCGGSSVVDECGVCNGSGIPDGQCDCEGNILDCAGECNGSAVEDCAGECNGAALIDCAGVCGGSNALNICDECTESGECNTDLCGCDDACLYHIEDCAGECNGTTLADCSGECGGLDLSCVDCAGIPNGDAYVDDCEQCVGGTTGLLANYLIDECGVCEGAGHVYGYHTIAAGHSHSIAIQTDGTVKAWGSNIFGQKNVPEDLSNVLSISAAGYHSLALKIDSTVVAWGDNSEDQINVPENLSDVVSVAAGYSHSLALQSDGTVIGWGNNASGQINVPIDLYNVISIAAGYDHSVALKTDGSIVAWGSNFYNQLDIPFDASIYKFIDADGYRTHGLRTDNTISGWGRNLYGEGFDPHNGVPYPDSLFQTVTAGEIHSIAVYADGTVHAWGNNDYGQNNVPDPDDFMAVNSNVIPECFGCMDAEACNYNPYANIDDDSCENLGDEGLCDCDGTVMDCAGECGGMAVIDCAGVCNGSAYIGTVCNDTDGDGLGDPGSEADACIIGSRSNINGCDLPDLTLFLDENGSVLYNSSEAIGGFQFIVEGSTIISASNGDAGDAGFSLVNNDDGSMLIGFSLTGSTFGPGCGTMVELSLDGIATALSNITISNPVGEPLLFEYYTYPQVNNCSDEYPDCYYNYFDCDTGECGGNVIDECDVCGGDGSSCITTVDLSIELGSGWNWLSINVEDNDNPINDVLSSIDAEPNDFIKGQTASAEYYEEFGWYGALTSIDVEQMYNLNVVHPSTLEYTGIPADPLGTPIALFDGWNWIGYLPQNAGAIDAALTSIGDSGQFIKNMTASAEYYEEFGWYGSIENMYSGDGYMLQVTGQAELIYPDFEENDELARLNTVKELPLSISNWMINPHSYEFNGTLTLSIDNMQDNPGDYIGVFMGDECRGVAEYMDFPFDNEDRGIYILMVYGEAIEEGEELTFQYYSSDNKEIIEYTESIAFVPDMIHGDGFRTFGLYHVMPNEFSFARAYPNPFNPVTTLEFTIPVDINVILEVYDINGRLIKELYNGNMDAGYHSVIWNADQYSSGMYFVKMISGEYVNTQKLMLVK